MVEQTHAQTFMCVHIHLHIYKATKSCTRVHTQNVYSKPFVGIKNAW